MNAFKIYIVILVILISASCESKSDQEHILRLNSFPDLVKYLDHDNINLVGLALWRMESIDDVRVPDLFVSLWERDGKYRSYYSTDIENNMLVKLITSSALLQFGYFHSEQNKNYIQSKIHDYRVHVRSKAIELSDSIGTVEVVEELRSVVLNDIDPVTIKAFESLLSIARKNKRLLDTEAIFLARKYVVELYEEKESLSAGLNKYLEKFESKNELFTEYDAVSDNQITGNNYRAIRVYPQILRLMLPYAENNDAYAKYIVAIKYLDGDEVAVDMDKGLQMLLESASLGYTYAYYELSTRYGMGKGLPLDPELEIHYLKLFSQSEK